MKKFLSIILSIVLVFSLCVTTTFALTDDEILNAKGTHNEVVAMFDMAANNVTNKDGTNSMTGPSPAGTYTASVVSQGTAPAYVDNTDPNNPIQYPKLSYTVEAITQDKLAETHPHLVNNSLNDKILKWSQNMGGAMFRVRGLVPHNTINKGDLVKITAEICVTDVRPYVDPTGIEVPIDNKCIDSYKMNFLTVYSTSQDNYSATKDGNGVTVELPVDRWVTFSAYITPDFDDITGIRIENSLGVAGSLSCVSKPCPNTILLGRIAYEVVKPNNKPIETELSYVEDFEKYTSDVAVYDINGTKADSTTSSKYLKITSMETADKYIYKEEGLTYKDSANPNNKNEYAKGSYAIDTNNTYEYVYPKSGTINGKYHLTGDASLGDTGVTDATFGLGYAGQNYITNIDSHICAADRLAGNSAKRSVITLPNAYSGKNMLVASGLYNKNAAVRMNNIFGSHPSKSDVGKKMIISYYVYADSKMGAYKVSDKDYASAEPVSVDITKPVKLMTSFNGPMGNIYKYRLSYDDTAIANMDIPWDTWTKVQILCEITSESIDNLVIENAGNTLKNCLQISQFGATDQIADTLYFDNLSIETIEAGTKAEYAVYEFDGSYDIAVKILSSTEAGNPTVQLVVGEYDAVDGRLLSVKTSANKTFSFSQLPVAISVSNFKPIKETSTLRAFLIDSYTGLCPYISPTDVKVIAEIIE